MKNKLIIAVTTLSLIHLATAQNLFPVSGNAGIGVNGSNGQIEKQLHILNPTGDATIRLHSNNGNGHRWDVLSSGGSGLANSGHFGVVDVLANALRFDIDANGQVGIGTDIPQALLHMKKTGDASIRIQNEYNNGGYQSRAYDLITSAGQGLATSGHFAIVDVNNNAQRLGIDGVTGMVYIGTRIGFGNTHNNAIFTANGKAVFREVVVTANWADYVFDTGYKLEPLEEVFSFIQEHHHLKGFKSAAEYENEGLPVGDILKLQQEKLEELTLYIIDLKKQLDELRDSKK